MEHSLVPHSATPLALAMVLGLLSHSVAWAIRVPPILLLVGAGMLMGPDGIGLLAPETLGDGFDGLVGLAAAAVFFAAGIAFEPTRLRTQGTASIHLVPGGFLLTFVGATLFGWGCFSSWDWSLAALFGSLIAATGPTALAPVLKRLRIKRSLSDALEQEAAQSMGMGAIGAMVFLPIAYQPADASSLSSLVAGIAGFGGGSLLGLLGGGLVIRIQRFQNRIPEGLEHALPLALVFLLFQILQSMDAGQRDRCSYRRRGRGREKEWAGASVPSPPSGNL